MKNKTFGDISKSIIEIEKELLTDKEIENRAGAVELFYNTHFKKFLALKELEWLRSMGTKDWSKEPKEHAIWHQGALQCLQEVRDWFKYQEQVSLSRFKKEEKPEPDEIINTI